MEKYLRPNILDLNSSSPTAAQEWTHWVSTFKNFLIANEAEKKINDAMKMQLFINHVSPKVYEYISECTSYQNAVSTLNTIFIKPKNEIFARHVLATRKQQSHENIQQYLQQLRILSKECQFKNVDAESNRNDSIRDAFISGLISHKIRERLLENFNLTLDEAASQAQAIEAAESNAQSFNNTNIGESLVMALPKTATEDKNKVLTTTPEYHSRRCFFCGDKVHRRQNCPAFNANCQNCQKKGHFANVCRSPKTNLNAATTDGSPENIFNEVTAIAAPASLKKSVVTIEVNGKKANALIDSGSSKSFINYDFFSNSSFKKAECTESITMAQTTHTINCEGLLQAKIVLNGNVYEKASLLIVKYLCADVIIGHNILNQHSKLEITFGGSRKPLQICSVLASSVPPVPLFSNLHSNCLPIAVKSRKYSNDDLKFIENEISQLLADGVIEESRSPWRAQVLITKNENHRKRLVIDYSQTINKYTDLDAYPLPNIEKMVNDVSKYDFFSKIDLKSAYHQVSIMEAEKQYTAFEACGKLYQFCRIPFGVTNGVSGFQRVMDWLMKEEHLTDTYAYLDDVTVCGKDRVEHDKNLKRFMDAVEKYSLTVNKEKSTFSIKTINLLGYNISKKSIKPDPDRLQPLISMPIPTDNTSLKRALGMFSHYSKWIPKFSERIHSLVNPEFPLNDEAKSVFEDLKNCIAKSTIFAIDENKMFTVETDASKNAIAATLTQEGRPVAFFSRTLSISEKRHSAIEKEAYAIVEALRKWRHYLIGRSFRLITDQRSVSFMFNRTHTSKIKNEKIERWRLELSCYKYDIIYRPGNENDAADALSRICAVHTESKLKDLHSELCHPGVTRMYHWIRSKNLPFSVEDVRKMTNACSVCAVVKPRFFKNNSILIKATSPFERLNIDFKGPVPSSSSNKYILTIIDEYSRFPFAFPCQDVSAMTVMKHLSTLFCIFGLPAYIHSDRGSAFMSKEVKDYLHSRGISTSRTTAYNPQGNGQIERANGTIWRTIQLALKSQGLKIEQWEIVLNQALHSMRSLLCTATNQTPHEMMFVHNRKSNNGHSVPTWLLTPGPVLLKKHNRSNKYSPLVEEVELLESNPDYSFVRLGDGRETTVSNRHLAPTGLESGEEGEHTETVETESDSSFVSTESAAPDTPSTPDTSSIQQTTRNRRPPAYLQDYDTSS